LAKKENHQNGLSDFFRVGVKKKQKKSLISPGKIKNGGRKWKKHES